LPRKRHKNKAGRPKGSKNRKVSQNRKETCHRMHAEDLVMFVDSLSHDERKIVCALLDSIGV
jgi:hypothetical protein